MGILTTLFGGSQLEKTPGAQPYIDKLGNFDPLAYGLKLGLGQAGKGAKQDYKDIRSGKDIGSIAGFSGTLGAIKSSYSAADRDRNREFNSNVALMNQPGLAAAQAAEMQRKSGQDQSNTIAQAAGGFYDRTQNMLNSAFQSSQDRRATAARDKLSADQAALQAYLAQFTQQQKGGIIPGIASLASGAAGVGSLFK